MRKLFMSLCILMIMGVAFADQYNDMQKNSKVRFSVESAVATDGNFSIGVAAYAPYYELGVFGGAKIIDSKQDTNTFVPGGFLGGRYHIANNTIFAYGVNFVDVLGKINDIDIDSNYTLGAYISLEQMLSDHVMLSLWVDPYAYNYEKLSGFNATHAHNIFNTGGFGLEYLF